MTTTTSARERRRSEYAWYPAFEGAWALVALAVFVLVPLEEVPPLALAAIVLPGVLIAFVRVTAAMAQILTPRDGGER